MAMQSKKAPKPPRRIRPRNEKSSLDAETIERINAFTRKYPKTS